MTLKTGAVFLDLTAAYDTIWHTGLLHKLSQVPASLTGEQTICLPLPRTDIVSAAVPLSVPSAMS